MSLGISKLKPYKEPIRVTIEQAENGYIVNRGYDKPMEIAKSLNEAMSLCKKCFEKTSNVRK